MKKRKLETFTSKAIEEALSQVIKQKGEQYID